MPPMPSATSSLKFGTSGLRGLVTDLTEETCRRYTRAFISHLQVQAAVRPLGRQVLVGQDLRPSSRTIAEGCFRGIQDAGLEAVDCGALPTPALALEAMSRQAPAIMVTGSHIPEDRNGLKFYRPDGEIDKKDERGIEEALKAGAANRMRAARLAPIRDNGALVFYIARYRQLARSLSLSGKRIGVYQHSSVARDLLVELLQDFGAAVVPLGRSDSFVPLDTEALEESHVARARRWVEEFRLDALVSADGDADRPLIADERGQFVRGDLVGLLTAQFIKADVAVTPITSSSSIERSGFFGEVVRTKVGSPFVIEAMAAFDAPEGGAAIGFEANGGVLLGSDILLGGRMLSALPTRDALLPILSVLCLSQREGKTISELLAELPSRFTASGRLENIPSELTADWLARLHTQGGAAVLLADLGYVDRIDITDGVQITLENGDRLHYRASGNAPELRCYAEARTQERAFDLLSWGLNRAKLEIAKTGAALAS